MTPAQIETIIKNCAYEPWQIVLRRDQIPLALLPGESHAEIAGRFYIQVRAELGKCNVTGAAKSWGGRKWFLSEQMTETEIVKTCLNAVIAAQTHETLEQFKYRGWAIFDPHIRVMDLVALRATKPLDARLEDARVESRPLGPGAVPHTYVPPATPLPEMKWARPLTAEETQRLQIARREASYFLDEYPDHGHQP